MCSVTPSSFELAVPFFDVTRQTASIQTELSRTIEEVCRSGKYIFGPWCERLEKSIAELCNTQFAIACASGSDALLLALMALEIGPGDEVLVPTYTFFSPAGAVARLGARPVFVDVEPDTFTIDTDRAADAISSHTKAIIPVHLFGQCANMTAVRDLAAEYRLAVVEDAAQAIGASYRGTPTGGLGDICCFSFFPTKNLGCFGDGGMLTTNNLSLASRLRTLRVHGMTSKYRHERIGINSRLDSLQAAILEVKLCNLAKWTAERSQNADRYVELFRKYGIESMVSLPIALPDRKHVWNQYVVRVPHNARDELKHYCAARGIGTEVYYPTPLHRQACFAQLPFVDCKVADELTAEALALPIFPELTDQEQDMVVRTIADFFKGK